MEIKDPENSAVPIVPQPKAKRTIKLEEVLIDRGLDFIEEEVANTDSVATKDTISELEVWCRNHKLSLTDVYFWIDFINIKIFGWDRPLIFVPRTEVRLLGFNYVFVLGTVFSYCVALNVQELRSYLFASIVFFLVVAGIYAMSLGRRARLRREKLFLPAWESFALRHKLRQ